VLVQEAAKGAGIGAAVILSCALAHVGRVEGRQSDAATPARKVVPPPPGRPVSDLARDLGSPDATVRAEAARELAGATKLPTPVWEALHRLARDDPERAVRLVSARALCLLSIHGGRGGIADTYDEAPRPIRMDSPRYPREARSRRITGVVRLLVLVDERGKVEDAEVIESIPLLDEAALRCVRKWTFDPGTRSGKPTPVYVVAPIRFSGITNVFGFTP